MISLQTFSFSSLLWILDVALGETTGKATPLKHVSNGLMGRPWQVAESTLLGNVRACDEREGISQVVNKELRCIKGDHATGTN